MAVTTTNANKSHLPQDVVQRGGSSNWGTLCSDPKTADTSELLIPSSVTRDGQYLIKADGGCTTAQVCCRYQTGQDITTALIIKLVGIDSNGIPQLLEDAEGMTSFTFDDTAASDLKDASGNSYTPAIEVDLQNNGSFMALVSTALVGGGTSGTLPALLYRLK